MAQKQTRSKQIADNRAVRHSYFVLEDFEAGIALQGNEVKSIRQGNVNLKDSWCDIKDGTLLLKGMHISPYEKDGLARTDPRRERQLLMHKREILRLFGKIKQDGLTLIPLNLHWSGSNVKVKTLLVGKQDRKRKCCSPAFVVLHTNVCASTRI